MKKLLLFCLTICLLSFVYNDFDNSLDIFVKNFSCKKYSIFVAGVVDNISNCKLIKNGENTIIECDAGLYKLIRTNISNRILGECVELDYNQSIENFLLKNDYIIVNRNKINDIEIISLYNKNILNNIIVDNQKINLQVAITPQTITVGTPILIGSF